MFEIDQMHICDVIKQNELELAYNSIQYALYYTVLSYH